MSISIPGAVIMKRVARSVLTVVCTAILTLQAAGTSNPGITDTEIIIGQCAALSGSAAALGTNMSIGLKAAFDEANAKGGVQGRKIRLVTADDGYEPDKCVDCTEKMIDENGVFALAGYVGTPTAKVAMPIVQEMKVPLVGLFTGAGILRQPVQRYVVNIRASYDDETEALVDYLAKTGSSKVAVLYQNDAFGMSGLSGVQKALDKRQLKLEAKGSFERNTAAIKGGLADILLASPDVVVIVAPYKPTAEFVRAAKAAGLKARFASISFVGTADLIHELGADAEGMVISQVLPSPEDSDLAVAKDYRAALKASNAANAPAYASFEGYVAGRLLLAAFDKSGKDLTREKLIDTINGMSKINLGGLDMSFSETDHQGMHSVYLTILKNGKAGPAS
jgi:ABC-type branched-subunit amino acid transport system substrate-binding protein